MVNNHPLLHGPGRAVRDTLQKMPGVTWDNGFEGALCVGAGAAELKLEHGEWLAFRLPLAEPSTPLEAVSEHRAASGNVRHAIFARRRVAMAETQLDGVVHLPHSVAGIAAGLRSLAEGLPLASPTDKPLADLTDAIAGLPYGADDIVRIDKVFELRLRVQGKLSPVRVSPEVESARIERVVLDELPAGKAAEAIAYEALRINSALRLARLSIRRGQLIAETRLHAQQLSATWIQMGAVAVAVAAHYAHTPLTMLARNPALVECYAELFLSRTAATQ